MRILVTGAGGMLGHSLVPALMKSGHDVSPTDLRANEPAFMATVSPDWPTVGLLDVRDTGHIRDWVERTEPGLIVHLAAETDVDRCEEQPDHGYATNALGTKHVALACQAAGIPIAYVSTAGVFDGEKGSAYTEYDPAYPINVYGRSKLEGERYVQSFLNRYYVVRAGWMVGGGQKDHKFVAKILRQLADGSHTLHAVNDKWGTPTYAPDFAQCFTRLLSTDSYGLYHMACQGTGTRYDVAKTILKALGRDDVELLPVDSAFFQEEYPAPRPRSEMMRNLLLDMQGLNTMRHWEVALEEYVHDNFDEDGSPRPPTEPVGPHRT